MKEALNKRLETVMDTMDKVIPAIENRKISHTKAKDITYACSTMVKAVIASIMLNKTP